jgi:hypothetical protein
MSERTQGSKQPWALGRNPFGVLAFGKDFNCVRWGGGS